MDPSANSKESFSLNPEEIVTKARIAAQTYEELLGIYLNRPALNYLKGDITSDGRVLSLWSRVVKHAEEAEVDIYTYIKAHFWFYNSKYVKAPKAGQLVINEGKFNSVDIVFDYIVRLEAGNITDKNIVGKAQKSPVVSEGARYLFSEKTLNSLMSNWGLSEDQIFIILGNSAKFYFDHNWLKNNSTYKKLKEEGRV